MTKDERYETFRREAEAAGLDVTDYHGRNFYHGPAVRCNDWDAMIEAIRATTVPVQMDELGLGYILYPR
jgi:hypothetical protein